MSKIPRLLPLIAVAIGGVVVVRAVLDEQQIPLSKVLDFKVGDTLMLNATPDSDISIRAGSIPLTTGRMGRKGQHIAVRVEAPIDVDTASSLAKGRR